MDFADHASAKSLDIRGLVPGTRVILRGFLGWHIACDDLAGRHHMDGANGCCRKLVAGRLLVT